MVDLAGGFRESGGLGGAGHREQLNVNVSIATFSIKARTESTRWVTVVRKALQWSSTFWVERRCLFCGP